MNLLSIFMGGVFLITVVGPSLTMGLFGTSSMAAGSLVVSLLFFFVFIISWSYGRLRKSLMPWVMVVMFGTGILYLQGVYSFFSYDAFDLTRFWQSYLLLILYSLGAYCFVILVCQVSAEQADGAIRFVFWALILSAVSGLVRFSPFFPETAFKSVLFYGEPSHFALNFLPLLLYMVVRNRGRMKIALLIGIVPLLLMLENLTLMAGFLLIFCMTIQPRRLLQLLPLLLVVFLALQLTDLEYYAERLDFSSSTGNLSSLVYMSGLERAYLNLVETGGVGVGFQQFGIVGSMGDLQESIAALVGQESNLFDGGSVAPKIIGEFGILGILVMSLYFGYFLRNAKWLLRESNNHGPPADPRDVFFYSCFTMYVIDLLVRGTGYFSSSGFMFVAALYWLFFKPMASMQGEAVTASSSAKSEGIDTVLDEC